MKKNISNGTHGSARSQLLHAITNISRPYMRGYLPISLLWHNFRYCISWIPTYRILNWYSIQVRLIRGLSLRNPCSLIMNRRSPLYGEIIVFALSSIWHANPGSEDQPIGLGNKTHLILAQWERSLSSTSTSQHLVMSRHSRWGQPLMMAYTPSLDMHLPAIWRNRSSCKLSAMAKASSFFMSSHESSYSLCTPPS